MNAIIILIIISVSVACLFLGAYFWSVKTGQYDDMESPAVRILLDDAKVPYHPIAEKINASNKTSNNKIN